MTLADVELTLTGDDTILTPEALAFVADLHRRFDPGRRALLASRHQRAVRLATGERPGLLPETAEVRAGDWRVAPPPADLVDRRVEITGPADAKMTVGAMNSGARCFMIDFEDSLAPTWANLVDGQATLRDAADLSLTFERPDGSIDRLRDDGATATLIARPRGLHLDEAHLLVDGQPVAGSLFDFGLATFHAGPRFVARGEGGPYFYLPKLESHLEARWWNEVMDRAEAALGWPTATIRATVLIETILAAFEMEEILYELRDRSTGLNAGRWDYIFSVIKKLGTDEAFVLPDRRFVTMAVPFMAAYAARLAWTCHRRGAHAIGGMAAFIPSRRDPEINARALAQVRADKVREVGLGFDGTWVAHPDLVPVATQVFDEALGTRPHQLEVLAPEPPPVEDLLDVAIEGSSVTRRGLAGNVSVSLRYLTAWLGGSGAVAVDNLMEDVATAEIARSQIWQWVHHGVVLDDATVVTAGLVEELLAAEVGSLLDAGHDRDRVEEGADLVRRVALDEPLVEFLTLLRPL